MTAMVLTSDGGYIMAGSTKASKDGDIDKPSEKMILIGIDRSRPLGSVIHLNLAE